METEQQQMDTLEKIMATKTGLSGSVTSLLQKLKKKSKLNSKDTVALMEAVHSLVSLQDQLLNVCIRDLAIADQRFNNLEGQLYQLTHQLMTLSTLLTDKTLITKEEVQETWDKKIKPAVEQRIKEMQSKIEEAATQK